MDPQPFVEASRELRGRLFSLVDSLSALRELTDVDLRHLDEGQLATEMLAIVSRYEELPYCGVHLCDGERLVRACACAWDTLDDSIRTTLDTPSRPITEGFMGHAATSGEVMRCEDCSNPDSAARAGTTMPTMGSLLYIPVLTGDKVVAVITAYHVVPDYFEPLKEHALTLLGGVLGQMFENNRLLREMEKAVTERTRQLETALREAEHLKRRYEQLSNVDELTSLHNRRFFFPEAHAVVARAVRYGQPLSVLILDIDHFKRVNDSHGHAIGDAVLVAIAEAMVHATREADIIARFGGEEFVAALPCTRADGAMILAERIRDQVAKLSFEGAPGACITVSIGVSILTPEKNESTVEARLDRLLMEADRALYQSKDAGRNRVSLFGADANFEAVLEASSRG